MFKSAFLGVILLSLIACNNTNEKEEGASKEDIEKAEKTIADKESRGDTLSMPAEKLAAFLPAALDGYKASGKPAISNHSETGSSWSEVKQQFKKGNSTIDITLADYNAAYGLYAGLTTLISAGYSSDSDEEKSGVVTVADSIQALVTYRKQTKEVSLLAGLSDRFVLIIEADNQPDAELVKSLAGQINLKELSTY